MTQPGHKLAGESAPLSLLLSATTLEKLHQIRGRRTLEQAIIDLIQNAPEPDHAPYESGASSSAATLSLHEGSSVATSTPSESPPAGNSVLDLLQHVRTQCLRGHLLGRVALNEEQKNLLRHEVLRGVSNGTEDKGAWGAAFFLAGVLAFKEVGADSTWTYDEIHRWLGRDCGLPGSFDIRTSLAQTTVRDAIDRNIKWWWNISLLQGGQGRLFQETMFLHSGATDSLVVELAEKATELGGWSFLERSEYRDIADLLPTEGRYRSLSEAETRQAVAKHLQHIALTRRWALQEGAARATAEETLHEIRRRGLHDAFDIENTELQRKLIDAILCRPGREVSGEPTGFDLPWCWDFARMCLALRAPEQLPASLFPPGADRVKVGVHGGTHHAIYVLKDDVLVRDLDSAALLPVDRTPATLVAIARAGVERVEIDTEHPFPGTGFALFDATTLTVVKAPAPHRTVVLVAEPGVEIAPPTGFSRLQGKLGAWMGPMPGASVEIGDGLCLAPPEQKLRIALDEHIHRIQGLSLGGCRVYHRLPFISVFGADQVWGTLVCPGDFKIDIPQTHLRGGRLVLEPPSIPGIYRIDLTSDQKRGSARFVLLPPQFVALSHRSHAGGTTLTASGQGSVRFRHEHRTAHNEIQLPTDVVGFQTVDVEIEHHPNLVGTWRLFACPSIARLQTNSDEVELAGPTPDSPMDMKLLRGAGGIRVYGPPSSAISAKCGEREIRAAIRRNGSIFVPFSNLFATNSRELELSIEISWPNASQTLGPFIDETRTPPEYELDGDILRIRRRGAPGIVQMKVISMSRPWEVAQLLDVRPLADAWFEARLPQNGPYYARLVENRRPNVPLTGLTPVPTLRDAPIPHDDILDDIDLFRGLLDRMVEDGDVWPKDANPFRRMRDSAETAGALNALRFRLHLEGAVEDEQRLAWLNRDKNGPRWWWLRYRELEQIATAEQRSRILFIRQKGGFQSMMAQMRNEQPPPEYHVVDLPRTEIDALYVVGLQGNRRSLWYRALTEVETTEWQSGPPRSVQPTQADQQAAFQELGLRHDPPIPQHLFRIEVEVAGAMKTLHYWRKGALTLLPQQYRQINHLMKRFPTLSAFWINRHAVQDRA